MYQKFISIPEGIESPSGRGCHFRAVFRLHPSGKMTNCGSSRSMADISDNSLVLSPMGNLAVNFSGTSLSSTPCLKLTARRLSMSSLTPGTPAENSSIFDCPDSRNGTPRLSKNALRLNGRSSFFRRMNSAPVTPYSDSTDPGQDGNKENSRKLVASSPLKCTSVGGNGSPLRGKALDKRDSGYAADDSSFRFTEPSGYPPKKTAAEPNKKKADENHGMDSPSKDSLEIRSSKFSALSYGAGDSFDDGFLELGELEKSFTDENEEAPPGMGNLLKGPLLDTSVSGEEEKASSGSARPPLRRFNSLVDNYTSPASSKARVGLFRDDLLSSEESPAGEKLPFKRPREVDCNNSKRRKSNSLHTISERTAKEASHSRYKLQRSISETAASSLAMVLHKSDLIADFTRPYALPMVSGRHEDLKSITSETLAGLLNGEYNSKVDSFKIIDCRYPYEYEGGHIKGSINLYTKEQVEQELFSSRTVQDCDSPGESRKEERNILIFHCEFSLERGPALYRFLRRCDRNLSSYPSLHYPEVYLLHGGYESFFSTHKSLCEPCSYQPMVDPKHENDLRKFRVKSNSWSGDLKRQASRSGLKRLGLF